jgi:hypothetical protein
MQGIHAGRRLVENQQVRVVDQGAAEPKLLLHAARQLAGRPLGEGIEPGAPEQGLDPLAPLAPALAEQPAEERQVLGNREIHVEIAAQTLGHIGDPGAHQPPVGGAGHVAPEGHDPPALDLAGAGDEPEQGRFAHPVRPDDAHHAPPGQFEGDAVEGHGLAVAVGDALDANRGPNLFAHWPGAGGSLTASRAGQPPSGPSKT